MEAYLFLLRRDLTVSNLDSEGTYLSGHFVQI